MPTYIQHVKLKETDSEMHANKTVVGKALSSLFPVGRHSNGQTRQLMLMDNIIDLFDKQPMFWTKIGALYLDN